MNRCIFPISAPLHPLVSSSEESLGASRLRGGADITNSYDIAPLGGRAGVSYFSPKVWNFPFFRLRAQEIALATGWPSSCILPWQANWATISMKRSVVIRVISFSLLAACGALGQKAPSTGLLPGSQFDGSSSEMRSWNSLPDAPSRVQPPPQAQRFQAFVKEASSPLTVGAVGVGAGVSRETELGHLTSGPQTSLAASYQSVSVPKESAVSAFLGKYLYSPLLKQESRNCPSTSSSFVNRAYSAASRIFITCDDSGKMRLNASYLLKALTVAAVHTAYRPYWARSASANIRQFWFYDWQPRGGQRLPRI